MKRIISFALAIIIGLSLFTACGNDGGAGSGSESSGSTKITDKIIKPSELITADDAKKIIGTDMEADRNWSDSAESFGSLRTAYIAENYMLQVTIRQDAQLDENDPADMDYLARGSISTYVRGIRGTYENAEDTIAVSGLGDWAGIVRPVGPLYSLYIVYNGYCFIEISLSGEDKDDDWQIGKLKEAGKLATKKLENASGVKPESAGNSLTWLWILLIALAVIAAGSGTAFIILRRRKNSEN